MKNRILHNGTLYETASPWMNTALINKSFNGSDYRIGFELEWKANINNYRGDFDEYVDVDEEQYVEDMDNAVSESLYDVDLFDDYLDTDVQPYFFSNYFKYDSNILNTSKFIFEDYNTVIKTISMNKEEKIKLKDWYGDVNNISNFSELYSRLLEVSNNNELEIKAEEDKEEVESNYDDLADSDVFGSNACLWFVDNEEKVYSRLKELDNQEELFGEHINILLNFYNLIMMNGEYASLKNGIYERTYSEVEDSARNDLRDQYQRENPMQSGSNGEGWAEIAGELYDIFGSKYNYEAIGEYQHTSSLDTFEIKTDSSIAADRDEAAVEIATPAFREYDVAIEALGKLFKYIDANGSTDDSCGLHISIDNVNFEKKQANALKMYVLFGDMYFLKEFNREKSSYAKSNKLDIYSEISKELSNKNELTSKDIDEIISALEEHYRDKDLYHNAIQGHSGYFEFRLAGGDNYQNKPISKYEQMIKIMCNVVTIGATDQYDKEYRQILSKLINNLYIEQQNKSFSNRPKETNIDINIAVKNKLTPIVSRLDELKADKSEIRNTIEINAIINLINIYLYEFQYNELALKKLAILLIKYNNTLLKTMFDQTNTNHVKKELLNYSKQLKDKVIGKIN